MNATIQYTFDLPEDEPYMRTILHAVEMETAIEELLGEFRKIRKYSEKEPTFDELDSLVVEKLSPFIS